LIEKYGEDSFEYEIRKVFDSEQKCREWEHRVLKKLKVVSRPDFLNKTDNIAFSKESANKGRQTRVSSDKHRKAVSEVGKSNFGRIISNKTKDKISKAMLGNLNKLGKTESVDTKIKKRNSRLGRSSGMLGKKQIICSCLFCRKELPYPNFVQHVKKFH